MTFSRGVVELWIQYGTVVVQDDGTMISTEGDEIFIREDYITKEE